MVCIDSSRRIVLDTNVALDWLIFEDPRFQRLTQALESFDISLVSDSRCLAELTDVLARPRMKVTAANRELALARYTSYAEMIAWREPAPSLPRCRDADDQLFLELAERSAAAVLISRDQELLRLDLQMRLVCSVSVLDPAAAVAALGL